jgi:hypothetical protein
MSPNNDSYLTCNEDKKTVIPEMRVVTDSLVADGIHIQKSQDGKSGVDSDGYNNSLFE